METTKNTVPESQPSAVIGEHTTIGGIVGDSIHERNCVKIHIDIQDIIGVKRNQIETAARDFMKKLEQILESDR